jgi:iron transport multicopper oxidase
MAQSKHSDVSANSEIESKGPITQKSASRRSLLGGILLVVLVALALGLGLGLGLKHGMHAHSPSNSTNSVTVVSRSQLVDPSQLVLSPSFDVNTPPQSREFNWTLSEIISDPTGTRKNMLVVNGISPGPTIEANFGDRQDLPL